MNRYRFPKLPRRIAWSIACACAFVLLEVFGVGDGVSILSGTPAPHAPLGAFGGLLYALMYFSTVVGAPILVLSWVLERIIVIAGNHLANRRRQSHSELRRHSVS